MRPTLQRPMGKEYKTMIKMHKRNKKVEVVAETPAVESPTTGDTPAPAEATTNGQEKANDKPKKLKYAPASEINNAAIIRLLVANPKKGKSRLRFDLYRDGMTVTEFVQAYTDANKKSFARPDLRWDLQHGFIKLEAPEAK